MADEPEEGFTVRDRRRFLAEPSETTPATPAPEPVREAPVTPGNTPSAVAAPPASPIIEAEPAGGSPLYDSSLEGAEDEGAYGAEGEFSVPDIYSVLFEFLQVTRTHAALRLGLLPNPSTGQIERDLDQAKVAIDTVIFLGKQIEPVIAPEERLPLQAMISELQMQYYQQVQRG